MVDYPNTNNILIEVKYRKTTPIADDAIVELRSESSAAIVLTRNADDFGVHNTKCGRDLLRIPAFAFLYLLGNAENMDTVELSNKEPPYTLSFLPQCSSASW